MVRIHLHFRIHRNRYRRIGQTNGEKLCLKVLVKYLPFCLSKACKRNRLAQLKNKIYATSNNMNISIGFIDGQKFTVQLKISSNTSSTAGNTWYRSKFWTLFVTKQRFFYIGDSMNYIRSRNKFIIVVISYRFLKITASDILISLSYWVPGMILIWLFELISKVVVFYISRNKKLLDSKSHYYHYR